MLLLRSGKTAAEVSFSREPTEKGPASGCPRGPTTSNVDYFLLGYLFYAAARAVPDYRPVKFPFRFSM